MAKKTEYVVYNDGLEVRRCSTEAEAFAVVTAYDGDHDVHYEAEEVEVEDDFEISEKLLAEWISFAKNEYNKDLTEDQAIEEIMTLHNKGCLVEHSWHCPGCPKWQKSCPI